MRVSVKADEAHARHLAALAARAGPLGSLARHTPKHWLVCFVPGLEKEWWHPLVHPKHQHVFAMRPLDLGEWLLVESWKKRLLVTVLSLHESAEFLRWGALGDILRVEEELPGRAWQTRGWSNCAVLSALLLGRFSWSWTPHGLYRQLMGEQSVQHVSFDQILMEQIDCARVAASQTRETIIQELQEIRSSPYGHS